MAYFKLNRMDGVIEFIRKNKKESFKLSSDDNQSFSLMGWLKLMKDYASMCETEKFIEFEKKYNKAIVIGWIEFNSNRDLFDKEAKKNCRILFDCGTEINYDEDHPMEIMTHFKLATT